MRVWRPCIDNPLVHGPLRVALVARALDLLLTLLLFCLFVRVVAVQLPPIIIEPPDKIVLITPGVVLSDGGRRVRCCLVVDTLIIDLVIHIACR